MDELSLGVSFRNSHVIEAEELRMAFRFFASEEYQPVPNAALFTYVVDYLGNGAITFPAGWTVAQISDFIAHWNTITDVRSTSWLLKHLELNEIKADHEAYAKSYVIKFREKIKQSSEHFRNSGQFSLARLRREERIYLFDSNVLPSFRRIMLERYTPDEMPSKLKIIAEEFEKRHGQGGPKVMEKLFSLMPTIELFAQLMAARVMNPERAVQPQDFWDIEHARVPAAYADAFVTRRIEDSLTFLARALLFLGHEAAVSFET
ncbi:MAG: hypothetical protein ACTFAL_06825 [Candidatus Electronema sp. V4]|uniref:hypothetical protein n=1 Tax=Candidatus Electronema sp. V4 TaxID=3454756 RepID=UPI00405573DE